MFILHRPTKRLRRNEILAFLPSPANSRTTKISTLTATPAAHFSSQGTRPVLTKSTKHFANGTLKEAIVLR